MNDNYIKVKIEGKNINNYIKWLIQKKINIINLNVIKHNKLEIIINYKDYKLLNKYSKTYKITIIQKYGKLRLIDMVKKNIIIFVSLILSIFFLYNLSNIIFSIDIVYNDQDVVNYLKKELEKYDIKKYKYKKDINYLNQVKEKILKDNKDTIEWIEIKESGTKYIVKLVERKKENEKKEYLYQSIVASKDSIITSIKAYSGEKTKNVNEYVKKDETIVSGILTKPDGTNIYKKAVGTVLGEVWYKVNIEYPLYYQEESVTGRNKEIISINFLNKKFSLFPYKKYKQFKTKEEIIIENNIIPLKILKEKLYEVNIKEEIYTIEEAIAKAIELSKEKILSGNEKILKINKVEIINKEIMNSKIKLNLFISVTEDITKIIEIEPELKDKQD